MAGEGLAGFIVEILAEAAPLAFADFQQLTLEALPAGNFDLQLRVDAGEIPGACFDALLEVALGRFQFFLDRFQFGEIDDDDAQFIAGVGGSSRTQQAHLRGKGGARLLAQGDFEGAHGQAAAASAELVQERGPVVERDEIFEEKSAERLMVIEHGHGRAVAFDDPPAEIRGDVTDGRGIEEVVVAPAGLFQFLVNRAHFRGAFAQLALGLEQTSEALFGVRRRGRRFRGFGRAHGGTVKVCHDSSVMEKETEGGWQPLVKAAGFAQSVALGSEGEAALERALLREVVEGRAGAARAGAVAGRFRR